MQNNSTKGLRTKAKSGKSMNASLARALFDLFHPLLQILHKNSEGYGEVNHVLKLAYISVVEAELSAAKVSPTTSRIAIQTGLTRKEVAALRKSSIENRPPSNYNRVNRVISGWTQDTEYMDKQGRAAVLPETGDDRPSMTSLITKYSGDMPVRSMLAEMERVGVIEERGHKLWELTALEYITGDDVDEAFRILGEDVGWLLDTLRHNIENPENTRFQRKVKYNNIPEEHVDAFVQLANRENQALLVKLNKWLAKHDRDSNPGVTGTGTATLGVGIYYFKKLDVLNSPDGDENPDDAAVIS